MKFLGDIRGKNLMLVNTLYHRATKDNDYCDYMDIIYKDLDKDSKHLVTIKNPQMEIFFTKEEARNYTHNRNFIELQNAYSKIVPYKSLEMEIAKEAGDNYVKMIQECRRNRNMSATRNIHKYRYVFGSDYDIENWYKIQWMLEYNNDLPKKITKQYLDIEVDSIDTEGFPRDGECPINAVTIVDEESMTSYTFLLRNENNPQIEEFENTIEAFIEELHDDFDETYGRLEYKFYMYDEYNEIGLIKDMFKLINTLKRDFLMIWNMDFDANFIIDRIKVLGYDPLDILCHKDFKIKQVYYHKDKLNFDVKNKADYFKLSSYTVFIDQMLSYVGLRKGQGELRSFALNAVAKTEIGDEKLDYSEDANIKTLPYVDYKKFVKYNIKDVLLQMGIERKTCDVEGIYDRALVNATSYHKVFKQTVFLKNRAYLEFLKQGLIIGNNVNVDYGAERKIEIKKLSGEDDDDDVLFSGAVVGNPLLNDYTGAYVMGIKSKYIRELVVDMDFSSMYPNIIITFNIGPNCLVGKLIIDNKQISDRYNFKEIADGTYDAGKDFMEAVLSGNVLMTGVRWFNLPDTNTLLNELEVEFGINKNKKKSIQFKKEDCEIFNAERIEINIY